jgi:hypothetical protein
VVAKQDGDLPVRPIDGVDQGQMPDLAREKPKNHDRGELFGEGRALA